MSKEFNKKHPFFDHIGKVFDIARHYGGKNKIYNAKCQDGKAIVIKEYEIPFDGKHDTEYCEFQQRTFCGKNFYLENRPPINITVFYEKETSKILHIAGIAENRNPCTTFDLFAFLFYENDYQSEYQVALTYYNSNENHWHYSNNVYRNHFSSKISAPPTVYGIASWMSFNDALDLNLFGRNDIYLGTMGDSERLLYPIRYVNDKHLITIAPSGTGKNRCVQIPNLLLNQNSIIALLIPKGKMLL